MLSVIICTYNREKYIYQALCSIELQDIPKHEYELIVINNNSTDNTEQICFNFQKEFPDVNFHYFIETQQGLSYARNKGIKESSGDIILYLDDDAIAITNWLSEFNNFFKKYPEAIAAGGQIIPDYEIKKPNWMSPITERLLGGKLYLGEKIIPFKNGKYPGGGNSAYRKEAFDKFGLFNPELGRKGGGLIGSEEKDMYDRFRDAGLEFYYLPKAIIFHFTPAERLTDEYLRKLSYSIGKGEKIRTKSISNKKYFARLISELFKWIATIILFFGYTITFRPQKGWKLIEFRWNLTKGLL